MSIPRAGKARPDRDVLMSVTVPVDVIEALARAGLRARDAEILTVATDPLRRRTLYRVRLDDGRTIKARRLESEDAAARQQAAREGLPTAFAAVVARSGAVLIEEWVEGRSLAGEPPDDSLVRNAARLLAGLHATPRVEGRDLPCSVSTSGWSSLTEARIAEVCATGALDASAAGVLRAALRDSDPGDAETGVVHLDFCGENMVINRDGRLRVIDNERVCVDAFGFDLARTRYRWALDDHAWRTFKDAYAGAGGSREGLAHLRFWRIVSIVLSAAYRLRSSNLDPSGPLESLRRLTWTGEQRRDPQ